MFVVVLAALLTAKPANFRGRPANLGREVRAARHEFRRHCADEPAVTIQFNAAGHHFHIVLAQALAGAMFTFRGAFLAGFDAAFVFFVGHKSSFPFVC
jgi:hypothetical protein